MTPNEYQQLAIKTEFTPKFIRGVAYQEGKGEVDKHWLVDAIEGGVAGFIEEEQRKARLIHGMIGLCTETGELQDMVKKNLAYGKPFDRVNVKEECGDILWYLALSLDAVGYTMEDAMEANIAKLKKRYPDKFSSGNALNRDIAAEREALERK
jgi:NTP pyrophosphatase (non-canonical NTP hydrolase)